MSSHTSFEVLVDGHKLLYTDVWLFEAKDELLLTTVSDMVRAVTECRHFLTVRWADSDDHDIKTWCRFIVRFDSQEAAFKWQLMWS